MNCQRILTNIRVSQNLKSRTPKCGTDTLPQSSDTRLGNLNSTHSCSKLSRRRKWNCIKRNMNQIFGQLYGDIKAHSGPIQFTNFPLGTILTSGEPVNFLPTSQCNILTLIPNTVQSHLPLFIAKKGKETLRISLILKLQNIPYIPIQCMLLEKTNSTTW